MKQNLLGVLAPVDTPTDSHLCLNVFKVIFTLSIVVFLSGCASYKDIKEMKVDASKLIKNIDAENLSSCMHEIMKENAAFGGFIFHRSYDPIRKKWFIASEFQTLLGSGNGIYNHGVSFEDTEPNDTKIEVRSLQNVWGSPQANIDGIFENAKKCQQALQ